ncbi:MAG: phosphoribosylformylglycinamidine synthase, partial [Clostridia bacterium]|nr:phosphoribosylformylglycinamidine synthase [Clostridia bacterium]
MVYRVYVEKKKALAHEALSLMGDIKSFLSIGGIESVRIINRYDVENITEELFNNCKSTVFSEPQLDDVTDEISYADDAVVFAVEYLPGQFDQRANSAAECIQLISQGDRPLVRTAKVYVLTGNLSEKEIEEIKRYVINPVEAREASLDAYDTLAMKYDVPSEVKTLEGFIDLDREGLMAFLKDNGLAMDIDDLIFCQSYFVSEKRDPTITEIKMIDTYWSDHCRHTTFLTTID